MAEVFKAKAYGAHGFEKIVALKRLLPLAEEDPEFIAMFISEARLAAQLSHPRICTIYELGEVGRSHYITMEYIYGRDLGAMQRALDGRPLEPYRLAAIGAQVADGLAYAHGFINREGLALDVVHRDISPPNIMVDPQGRVSIIDFGIATFEGRDLDTQAGILKGKSAYMSPEQVRKEPLDARSDIFSLGVVLHELATGRRLFRRDTAIGTLEAVESADVPPLTASMPDFPPELDALIGRCLRRDREDRFTSAGDAHQAFATYLRSETELLDWEEALAPAYAEIFGADPIMEDAVSIAEYEAALRAAEDGDAETTDRKGVADATVVYIQDTTDLRAYVSGLGQRIHQPATPSSSDANAGDGGRPVATLSRVCLWVVGVAVTAYVLGASLWQVVHHLR